jgi:hypothetical protein
VGKKRISSGTGFHARLFVIRVHPGRYGILPVARVHPGRGDASAADPAPTEARGPAEDTARVLRVDLDLVDELPSSPRWPRVPLGSITRPPTADLVQPIEGPPPPSGFDWSSPGQ